MAIEYLQNTGFCAAVEPTCTSGVDSTVWMLMAHKIVNKFPISTFYLATEDYGVLWGAEQITVTPTQPNPSWLLHNNYTQCSDPARVPGSRCDLLFTNLDKYGDNWVVAPDRVPFEPRVRPWYTQITGDQRLVRGEGKKWTQPYLSVTADVTAEPVLGVTLSGAFLRPGTARTATPVLAGVVAADIYFVTLSQYFSTLRIGEGGVGCAYISDQSFLLMASSSAKEFTLFDGKGKDATMLHAAKSADPRIAGSAEALIKLVTDGSLLSYEEVTHVSFRKAGTHYVASAINYKDRNGLAAIIVIVLPVSEYLSEVNRATTRTLIISAAVVIASLIVSVLVTMLITRPLQRFKVNVASLGQLDLKNNFTGSNIREIVEMESALNKARKGLRSFTKFVPARVVRQLLNSDEEEIGLGVKPKNCVVLFVDMAGFTRISESMPPFKLIGLISEVFAIFTDIIERNEGVVDKFIGDCAMAFWGAPRSVEKAEDKACQAAVAIQEEVARLRAKWDLIDGMPRGFSVRIGIHTGPVLAGIVGAPNRFAYTVVGDTVNVAARLEAINKPYGTGIMCSAGVRARTSKDRFIFRRIDRAVLQGRPGVVDLVEVVDMSDMGTTRLSSRPSALVENYNAGFTAYLARDFATALKSFKQAKEAFKTDKPTLIMIARCEKFLTSPPPADWDGNAGDL